MPTENSDRFFLLEIVFLACLIVLLLALSVRFRVGGRRMNADSVYYSRAPEHGAIGTAGNAPRALAAPEVRPESRAKQRAMRRAKKIRRQW